MSVVDRILFPCMCVLELSPLKKRDLDRRLNVVLGSDLALRLGHLIGVLFSEEPWS